MIQGISPAISAVKNLGKRIGNVANNVANVATSGYKKSRSTASSLPGYNVSTASGTSQVGMGSALGDISMTRFTSPPIETTAITNIINLDSEADNHVAGANGLSGVWDGGDQNYEYNTTTKIYDSLGAAHDMNIYFYKAETDGAWEMKTIPHPCRSSLISGLLIMATTG
jgi:flagellar hook protein FlgE